jgi:predicted TIM-barrel fold metal-dependent hydrolase
MKKSIALILCRPLILLPLSACLAWSQANQQEPPPIVDMHLHASDVTDFGASAGSTPRMCSTNEGNVWFGWDPRRPFKVDGASSCAGPMIAGAMTDEDLMRQTFATLKRYNIRAVTSSGSDGDLERVSQWRAVSPDRIIPAASFLKPGREPLGQRVLREPAELRRLVSEGKIAVFAEVAPQYDGMSPANPSLDPYFALAEELDIPVGIHMGEGPPGGPNVEGYSPYRVRLGNPLLLEDVLIRHPKLRLYVMHYGSPFVDDMIALLYSYPQVYVDVAGDDWESPRKQFYSQLRRLVEAGFEKRILFGSDQMIWPDTIRIAIETIQSADFLTEEQKRDIFYNNAVRFLRLEDKGHSQNKHPDK